MSDEKHAPHNHDEYEVSTNLLCFLCGEFKTACAMCGQPMHICKVEEKDPRIIPGYRAVADFPDYMVNNQATVRHIQSQRYCMLVRVSKSGGAMINLVKDGKKYTKAAQELRDKAFGVPSD